MSGCGVVDHDEDCLCDITLPDTPTPVGVGLGGNWVLKMVADYFDLSYPWTPDKIVFLLERAGAYIEAHAVQFPKQIVGMGVDVERGNGEPFPSYAKRVKAGMEQIACALGPSVLPSHVRDHLGLTHEQFVSIITMNRTDPALVTPDLYDRVTLALRDGEPFKRVCRLNGLPDNFNSGIGAWIRRTFVEQFANLREGQCV